MIATYLATDLVDQVFSIRALRPRRSAARGLWLRGADLLRFLRLQRHGHRPGRAARLSVSDQLRPPYRAQSLREFWRRWHISLSSWLRDYLYMPLGGSRGSRWFTTRNLMITMLLGGIWHGAAWNFVAWGGLHGAGLVVERWWQPWSGAWAARRWAAPSRC